MWFLCCPHPPTHVHNRIQPRPHCHSDCFAAARVACVRAPPSLSLHAPATAHALCSMCARLPLLHPPLLIHTFCAATLSQPLLARKEQLPCAPPILLALLLVTLLAPAPLLLLLLSRGRRPALSRALAGYAPLSLPCAPKGMAAGPLLPHMKAPAILPPHILPFFYPIVEILPTLILLLLQHNPPLLRSYMFCAFFMALLRKKPLKTKSLGIVKQALLPPLITTPQNTKTCAST